MPEDEEAEARKQRAEALQKQIEEIVAPEGGKAAKPAPAKPPGGESPREFIHRKMREGEEDAEEPESSG